MKHSDLSDLAKGDGSDFGCLEAHNLALDSSIKYALNTIVIPHYTIGSVFTFSRVQRVY